MLQSVCWAGQRLFCSFCACWEVRPRRHQNSSLALEARLGQGLGPSSMETGLLLQERRPLLTLPEVGCVPSGMGTRGQLLVFLALCHLLSRALWCCASCDEGRCSFSVANPGAGTLFGKSCLPHVAWPWLGAPLTAAAPGQTCMNPVHIQWFFSPCSRCVLPLWGFCPKERAAASLHQSLFTAALQQRELSLGEGEGGRATVELWTGERTYIFMFLQ